MEPLLRKPQTPVYRRALGELTNTPLLLSPGAGGSPRQAPHPSPLGSLRSQEVHHLATPPKVPGATTTSSPDTITPTHNLKLLTELASKLPGATSSARQTLQFEDQEPLAPARLLLLGQEQENSSPHRDHSYIPRRPELAPAQAPTPPSISPCPTSIPEKGGGNRKDKSLGILAERMLASLPYAMGAGESTELQLDDTARLLCTERRRIYDIVNVFEAVQIMSKVSPKVTISTSPPICTIWSQSNIHLTSFNCSPGILQTFTTNLSDVKTQTNILHLAMFSSLVQTVYLKRFKYKYKPLFCSGW